MLQSLISLSDQDVECVIDTVRDWCSQHHCTIDSRRGRLALTTAVDLIQTTGFREALPLELSKRLDGPVGEPPDSQ
ncbi:hypothetical protein HFO94_13380 [Rhizobium leguminosarum]|uniref:hypothetical protein n=1 Tax=Rhizobium TaxID=379 RepID=UPI00035E894F|nr:MULTISPECIES: hypothetical protein [Rhizobium]MBY5354516.1 hypothetical protein [Rhizobium leguminosarum]MBY5371596.1 hypothetical protein [Rhizobium leguminosarum]MBY5454466.1 hypothetical protein [Rhizobium leguminosarum]NDK52319.1 hypothetical protein [Rhizobium laguerreae]